MRVLIDHMHGLEWWTLCHEMLGRPMVPIDDFMMSIGPGESGRACVFDVDDSSAIATWIRLKHPEWIEPAWIQLALKGRE